MPANLSEQKINVVKSYGQGTRIGWLAPQVNMLVRSGIQDLWIVGLASGNFTVDLSLTSGGAVIQNTNPYFLMINESQASGFYWPNGSESLVMPGHSTSGEYPASNLGYAILKGDGTVTTGNRNAQS